MPAQKRILSFIKYNNSSNQTNFENDSGILILNDNNMKYRKEVKALLNKKSNKIKAC